jgi:hypothetical protein
MANCSWLAADCFLGELVRLEQWREGPCLFIELRAIRICGGLRTLVAKLFDLRFARPAAPDFDSATGSGHEWKNLLKLFGYLVICYLRDLAIW